MVLLAEIFDNHMRAIGIMVVRWSSVDDLLFRILRDRLFLPMDATRLRFCGAGVSRLNFFRARLNNAIMLSEEKTALNGAINRLIDLCDERNMIIHGQYGIMVTEDGSIAVSYSGIALRKKEDASDDRLQPAPVTVDHLMEHADAVYNAAEPLSAFLYQRPNNRSMQGESRPP